MALKESFSQFRIDLEHAFEIYNKLQEELNKYRGKEITDDILPDVNRILHEIQDTYTQIYPAIDFILKNHKNFHDSLFNYNKFIEMLKEQGAKPDKEATA